MMQSSSITAGHSLFGSVLETLHTKTVSCTAERPCFIKSVVRFSASLASIPLTVLAVIEGVAKFALGLFIWVIAKACSPCTNGPQKFYDAFFKDAVCAAGRALSLGLQSIFCLYVCKKSVATPKGPLHIPLTEKQKNLLRSQQPSIFYPGPHDDLSPISKDLLLSTRPLLISTLMTFRSFKGDSGDLTPITMAVRMAQIYAYAFRSYSLAFLLYLTSHEIIGDLTAEKIDEIALAIVNDPNVDKKIKEETLAICDKVKKALMSLAKGVDQRKFFEQFNILARLFNNTEGRVLDSIFAHGIQGKEKVKQPVRAFVKDLDYENALKELLRKWNRSGTDLVTKIIGGNLLSLPIHVILENPGATRKTMERLSKTVKECGDTLESIHNMGEVAIDVTASLLGSTYSQDIPALKKYLPVF